MTGAVVFFLTMAVCLCLGAALWRLRVPLASRLARGALDRQGLADLSFRLSQLSPGRVVVQDIRWGKPAPVLSVDRVDVRFSLPELKRRRVERLDVQGVKTTLISGRGKMNSPLAERLKPMLAAAQKGRGAVRAPGAAARFSVSAATVRDVRVEVVSSDRAPLAELTMGAGAMSEAADRYRVWGCAQDGRSFSLKAEGTVLADAGQVSVTPELRIGDVGALIELARRIVPERVAAFAAVPTNCSLTARGDFSFENWTNAGPFEVSAELGRGSAFAVPSQDAWVRFQTLRAEAAGTPRDASFRVSAGVAGFRIGGLLQASQEVGRMLSLRGSARFRQTATNQWLTATLDSDLPGRSIAKVLPRVLPLVPVFFSDGGTLRTEAEVSRPPRGEWQGQVAFAAEALRSSAPLAAGRFGAAAVSVTGTVEVADSKPGAVKTEIVLSNGYFYRQNLTVKGDGKAELTMRPPYASASGTFQGRVSESAALPKLNLFLQDGSVPFQGEAAVTGLPSKPQWQVALRVPEFGVASTRQSARAEGTAGAVASVWYGPTNLAVEGEAWVRDVSLLAGPESNRLGEAGLSRIAARFKVPEFNPASASNAVVGVTFGVSNGWAKAGALAVLEDARCEVPFEWSPAAGFSFLQPQRLTWRRLEAQGLKVMPDGFSLAARDRAVEARFGVRVAESKMRVAVQALVPLDDPKRVVVDVTLPDTEIASDDAVAAVVRGKVKGAEVSGHVAAEAKVRFLGSQPQVLGRGRVSDGRVRSGKAAVEGVAADVPFESGALFRTIERPFVTFKSAKAGNMLLGQGRFEFQLTPGGVFVDRLEVGWCNGSLNAYSVHLDFKNPKDDFIVYADRIDLGAALMMVMPFKGKMEGVLYGRFPVGFDKGHVKLSTGYLYSLPGQGGKLRLDDHKQMQALLDKSGIRGDIQMPLSKALSDMDFNTFKMELEPKTNGDGTLRIRMVGHSNDKAWPAPVDLNMNLNGPLEDLLNMGIGVSRK